MLHGGGYLFLRTAKSTLVIVDELHQLGIQLIC